MEENFRDCKTEDNTKYDGERDFERLKSLGREARVVTDDQSDYSPCLLAKESVR